MRSTSPQTPFGYTLFCDDVRQEVGNKQSYIGIYSERIVLSAPFPAKLPKFTFVVSYFETLGESDDPVTLKIWLPGDPEDQPTFNHPVPVEELRSQASKLPSGERLNFHMAASVIPIEFKEAGLIKVRAYRGDLEIKLGTIKVETAVPAKDEQTAAT